MCFKHWFKQITALKTYNVNSFYDMQDGRKVLVFNIFSNVHKNKTKI